MALIGDAMDIHGFVSEQQFRDIVEVGGLGQQSTGQCQSMQAVVDNSGGVIYRAGLPQLAARGVLYLPTRLSTQAGVF